MNQDLQQLGPSRNPVTQSEGAFWKPRIATHLFDPTAIDDAVAEATPQASQMDDLVARSNPIHLQQWVDDDTDPFAPPSA